MKNLTGFPKKETDIMTDKVADSNKYEFIVERIISMLLDESIIT